MSITATARVSLNDVRARILRMPSDIRHALKENGKTLSVGLDGEEERHELTVSANRTYLGGVTDLFRRASILRSGEQGAEGREGALHWSFDPQEGQAEIRLEPQGDWCLLETGVTKAPSLPKTDADTEVDARLIEVEDHLSQQSVSHRPFFVPVVRAIAKLGGSARKRDVVRELRSLLAAELNEKQLDYLESKNRYGWARHDLRNAGLVTGEYGTWTLTELGQAYELRHRDDELAVPLEIPEADAPARSMVQTETVQVSGFRAYEIPILKALAEGATEKQEILEAVVAANRDNLLPGDRRAMPVGIPVWQFRASWALSNLGKAGHAENVGTGEWVITEAGRQRLEKEAERWSLKPFQTARAKVRLEGAVATASSGATAPSWDANAWDACKKTIGRTLHTQLSARLRPELGPAPDAAVPRNVILYGPPGTGKTFVAKAVAHALTGEDSVREDGRFRLVQFHPSYAYEDFVQGLRPDIKQTELRYKMHEGPLKRIADAAEEEPDCFYVLVIDEINRGDPARIFGELLYALEYRDEAVSLPMGGELRVPSNLVIIGTMNSVDRSVALVDYALRRRFGFIRVDPDPTVIQKVRTDSVLGETGPAVLENFNAWVRKRLGREYQLGHSYFLSPALPDDVEDVFDRLWALDVQPLLEEYFFGDELGLAEAEKEWRRLVAAEQAAKAEVETEQDIEETAEQ